MLLDYHGLSWSGRVEALKVKDRLKVKEHIRSGGEGMFHVALQYSLTNMSSLTIRFLVCFTGPKGYKRDDDFGEATTARTGTIAIGTSANWRDHTKANVLLLQTLFTTAEASENMTIDFGRILS